MKSRISELTQVERWALGHEGRVQRKRKDWKPSPALMRLREIEKLIRSRHGQFVPDPEDTEDRDNCLAYVKAAAFSLAGQDLTSWCSRWAPWVRRDEITVIEAQAGKRRRMMTPDGVAGLLSVTWRERGELSLRTIGACDLREDERKKLAKELKRQRDRDRQVWIRQSRGCKDRKSHAASTITHQKPWEAEGISRATWYRRQRETEKSRIVLNRIGDAFVSTPSGLCLPPLISVLSADGEAGRREGLGDHPPAEIQEAEPHGSGDTTSQQVA